MSSPGSEKPGTPSSEQSPKWIVKGSNREQGMSLLPIICFDHSSHCLVAHRGSLNKSTDLYGPVR